MGDFCSRLCGDSSDQSKHTGLSVECTGNTCTFTPANRQQTQYSWDNRPRVDPTIFTVENKENEVIHRLPDTTGGNQFIIQNCKNCHIYILDGTSTVTVDDCINCVIFLGPVKTSLFMRDCSDCRLMTACQQFRLRDCKQLTVFLCCNTQPIIESSTAIRFSCFTLFYPQLKGQFDKAGLRVYNNNWSNIHDFTPVQDEKNFTLMSASADKVEELMKFSEHCTVLEGLTTSSSVVPLTIGSRHRPASHSSCLLVFSATEEDLIGAFVSRMKELQGDHVLVQTHQLSLSVTDAQRVLQTDRYNSFFESGGECVVLEYSGGADICDKCREVMSAAVSSQQQQQLRHISENSERAAREIEAFNDLANMQLAI